ncbi:MAG: PHP domain-containing protein [Chloroflexi bacterium]|nr:PHP domain-containing protein [Chloroflexota bacterium]
MRQKQSFEGVFRRGEPDLPFRYVAFDVPPGAKRLEVSYHFQRAEQPEGKPDDVVDLGIFDARGAGFLSGGFRGWSGGARRSVVITPHEATPGYLRGPLIPGEWRVLLGARINHSDAMPYWVHLSLDVDPEAAGEDPPAFAPSRPARASAARSGPGRWYKGDFHSHTVHSDGYNSIAEYAVEARRVGLDFLAITDHNTTSHFEEIATQPLRDGLLLIPGEEVTTFWGHANVWGAGCWVDFRATDGAGMERIIQFVEGRGGLFSVNHPKASAGYPWEFDVHGYRIVEAWQGAWRWHNHESIDFWERRLRAGDRVVAVGGSDCHSIPPAVFNQPWTLGNPCTWVYVPGPLDEEAVLDAVRAGHAFVSEDPTGPYLELTAECAGVSYLAGDAIAARQGASVRLRLRYRGPAGKKLRLVRDGAVWREAVAEREEQELEFALPLEGPGYLRAEAAGFRGRPERGEVLHALTNPIYFAPAEA